METLKLIINEHITNRHQIVQLAKSDLNKTYRGAALGWLWAVIKPMVTLFVFWFGFVVGLRNGKPINGYPYFLWLVGGFLPWFYMQEMIPVGANCIRQYKHLVTKMKFPISIIPTYVSLSHLMVNLVLTVIAIVIYAIFGFPPDRYYLQIPLYTLMMFVSFTVWGLLAGMLSAISKDFQNMVKACTSAIFWMSGIIYNVDNIHNPIVRTLLKFNPVTDVATGYRNSFIYKKWFWEDKRAMLCYMITLTVSILLALWVFKKLRKEIPDIL